MKTNVFQLAATRWRSTALATALLIAMAIAGCAAPQISDYAGQKPAFDFRHYFDGTVLAHGKVIRRFVVTMKCEWVGDEATLDEAFVYDDGERQHRLWRVKMLPGERFVGTADDVVGEARGESAGAAFNWRYTLSLPVDGTVYEVQFDDWMHRIDERVVLNRAVMSKFGVRVGEITLSFTRQ
jgi:hypothetical protein